MMDRPATGVLIAIEGIDGAGKTTQARLLADFLSGADDPPICSKEPTDGPWGRKIRESSANGRMSFADELQAFIEDRKEHVRDLILPALAQDKTVILDRYLYSTAAYQGSRDCGVELLMEQMLIIAPEPDVVFLLDVEPEIGLARISRRGDKPNAFETLANLQAVREGFLTLAKRRENIDVIDAAQSIEAVFSEVRRHLINGVLKSKRCAKPWGCDEPLYCTYQITDECRWARIRKSVNLSNPY